MGFLLSENKLKWPSFSFSFFFFLSFLVRGCEGEEKEERVDTYYPRFI